MPIPKRLTVKTTFAELDRNGFRAAQIAVVTVALPHGRQAVAGFTVYLNAAGDVVAKVSDFGSQLERAKEMKLREHKP